jgi:hypothetical protein
MLYEIDAQFWAIIDASYDRCEYDKLIAWANAVIRMYDGMVAD